MNVSEYNKLIKKYNIPKRFGKYKILNYYYSGGRMTFLYILNNKYSKILSSKFHPHFKLDFYYNSEYDEKNPRNVILTEYVSIFDGNYFQSRAYVGKLYTGDDLNKAVQILKLL